jgi:predicted aconitase
MDILVRVGAAAGADGLIDVTRAHLVGAYDIGPANRVLLGRLADMHARVRIPTTLNATSACLASGLPGDPDERRRAGDVVARYVAMGCRPTLTCAPYHLEDAPRPGECIAWAESNAVVYANSVLGARTNHTVQYLDLCAALTGRIPCTGLYRDDRRRATVEFDVSILRDAAWRRSGGFALLGLWLGRELTDGEVPWLSGMPPDTTRDELRTLGAAAASAGSLALFHAEGLTPEAPDRAAAAGNGIVARRSVTARALQSMAAGLAAPAGTPLNAVCLGTPHYSLDELRRLHAGIEGAGSPRVPVFVTTSRATLARADAEELGQRLKDQGVTVLTDTCTYYGQVVPGLAGTVMTDSAKWAWYGSGNLGVRPVLAGLERCLASAHAGRVVDGEDEIP